MQEAIKRKIPDNMHPWVANVNGVKHVYPAGTEQDVPEEVAAIIDAYWASKEKVFPNTAISFNELRDRPFGPDDPVVLFDEHIVFDTDDDVPIGAFTFPEMPAEGDVYTIYYNGLDYECKAVFHEMAPGIPLFGNLGPLGVGDDTGEPFFFSVAELDGGIYVEFYALDGAVAGDIKIEKVNIEKIDGKYLPDGYPYVAEVTAFNRIVDIADYDGHDWYYAWYGVDEPLYHKLGEKATVEFDGESYHLSVLDFENSKVLGDMVVMNQGATPKYPFVITIDHRGGMVIACRKQITTKVKILIPEVKTIDPKFLPDVGGGGVVYTFDGDSGMVINIDGSEVTVEQAKNDSFNVIICNGDTYYRPICVKVTDGTVVFTVKPPWDEEYQVVVGEQPK